MTNNHRHHPSHFDLFFRRSFFPSPHPSSGKSAVSLLICVSAWYLLLLRRFSRPTLLLASGIPSYLFLFSFFELILSYILLCASNLVINCTYTFPLEQQSVPTPISQQAYKTEHSPLCCLYKSRYRPSFQSPCLLPWVVLHAHQPSLAIVFQAQPILLEQEEPSPPHHWHCAIVSIYTSMATIN
ncbi:hypothetical protein BX070DRAFT_49629 [Coemansia spiralis]|nr:hypothetical protein BX070DRAFT_49629 [Coemansia spiralis]